eukprot:GGOE01002539.1.p1 GENE.GGOE01002539.1~~GGOE01002539.1.p1  ORF type:complete len:458 (+),score=114.68 GGOE01002539.1:68-1441(+)
MPIHTRDADSQPLDGSRLQRAFAALSALPRDQLTRADAKKALRRVRVPCTESDAGELLWLARAGQLDLPTFESFVLRREQLLHELFRKLDPDGSGFIDLEAFARAMGHYYSPEFDTEDYLHMLGCFRYDNNSTVTYTEFRQGLLLLPSLHVAAVFDRWTRSAMDIGEDMTVPEAHQSFHKPMRTFIAGAIAGALSRTATAPLDRLKVLLQASSTQYQSQGVLDGLRAIYKEGGMRAFWRGNGANIVKIAPESGIKFFVFDHAKRRLAADPKNATVSERLCAGAMAGVVSQTCIYPLETIKTRMAIAMTGTYCGMFDCGKQLYRAGGIRSFYRGYVPSVLGIVPYCGVDLMMYSGLKQEYARRFPLSDPTPITLLACGVLSSSCGQLVSYPFALVRTRLQAQTAGGTPQYRGMVHCAVCTVRQDGPWGLYRGLRVNFMKTLPAIGISYVTYEEILKLL